MDRDLLIDVHGLVFVERETWVYSASKALFWFGDQL